MGQRGSLRLAKKCRGANGGRSAACLERRGWPSLPKGLQQPCPEQLFRWKCGHRHPGARAPYHGHSRQLAEDFGGKQNIVEINQ